MILPRQYYGNDCYYNRYNRLVCRNSRWNSWGRWVVLGIIIVVAIFLFFLCSCVSAKRRRKLGHAPYRGTGWAIGRPPAGHGQANYTSQPYYAQPQQQQQQQPYYNNSNNPPPPPAYSPPPNNSYNQNIELQQPGATYQGGYRNDEQYAPPKDPPPRH